MGREKNLYKNKYIHKVNAAAKGNMIGLALKIVWVVKVEYI